LFILYNVSVSYELSTAFYTNMWILDMGIAAKACVTYLLSASLTYRHTVVPYGLL